MIDLKTQVPAAFATEPARHTSDRYSFIPTLDIVNALAIQGWVPNRARQSKKTADPKTARHIITFRNVEDRKVVVGKLIPEINLTNAHDATSRFRLLGGLFRGACSNGAIIPLFKTVNVERIHIDGAKVDVDEALLNAIESIKNASSTVEKWQTIDLDWGTRLQLAQDAVVLRNKGDVIWSKHFDAHEFLTRRRLEDKPNDLWTVFNVLQENLLKGGVQGVSRLTKPITQVAEQVRINTGLWQLAEKYGKLHGTS